MKREITDATMSSYASKLTTTGAGTAVVGGLSHNEVLAIIGAAVAVLGLLTNWYFQHRRDARERREDERREAEHQKRMRQMQTKPGDLHDR